MGLFPFAGRSVRSSSWCILKKFGAGGAASEILLTRQEWKSASNSWDCPLTFRKSRDDRTTVCVYYWSRWVIAFHRVQPTSHPVSINTHLQLYSGRNRLKKCNAKDYHLHWKLLYCSSLTPSMCTQRTVVQNSFTTETCIGEFTVRFSASDDTRRVSSTVDRDVRT